MGHYSGTPTYGSPGCRDDDHGVGACVHLAAPLASAQLWLQLKKTLLSPGQSWGRSVQLLGWLSLPLVRPHPQAQGGAGHEQRVAGRCQCGVDSVGSPVG